jgi:hypothetical protein
LQGIADQEALFGVTHRAALEQFGFYQSATRSLATPASLLSIRQMSKVVDRRRWHSGGNSTGTKLGSRSNLEPCDSLFYSDICWDKACTEDVEGEESVDIEAAEANVKKAPSS